MKTVIYLRLIVIAVEFILITGLRCYHCTDAWSNEECLLKGKIQTCEKNERVCITIVRRNVSASGRVRITKRCKEALACDNAFRQNSIGPVESTLNAAKKRCLINETTQQIAPVCRCCCVKNLCNSKVYDACEPVPENLLLLLNQPPRCPTIKWRSRNLSGLCTRRNEPSSFCNFRCLDGFRLKGKSQMSCQLKSPWKAAWTGAAPCCARTCPPHPKVDLVIGFQSSGLERSEWQAMKRFVASVAREFIRLTTPESHIGVFSFTEKPNKQTEIALGDNRWNMFNKISNFPHDEGAGNGSWYATLRHVETVSLAPSNGNRVNVEDYVVLIFNGLPNDVATNDATIPARNLRDDRVKFITFGILPQRGISKSDYRKKLYGISGSYRKIILSTTANLLRRKLFYLKAALCGRSSC